MQICKNLVMIGIQLFNNDDGMCPERHGGSNVTKVYIDSGVPLLDNIWREDKCFLRYLLP